MSTKPTLIKHAYIIARGEYRVPQHLDFRSLTTRRYLAQTADDLTDITIFEDHLAAESARRLAALPTSDYHICAVTLTLEIQSDPTDSQNP